MAFHCTNCNGSVVFDVGLQQMRCEHCGSTFDPDEFVVRDEGIITCKACGATMDTKKGTPKFCGNCGVPLDGADAKVAGEGGAASQGGIARFTCQSCGAELEGTDDSMIGFCPYCAGQSLIKETGGKYSVEGIVPFQVDKERCVELYGAYTKGVRFLPRELRDPAFIQKFTGIYMPFYQYDLRLGDVELEGHKTVRETRKYREIEHYAFEVKPWGNYERGVTFDGSRYLDDEISERAQPFDQEKRRAFNPAYLAGFYADSSTVDADIYHADACAQGAENLVEAASDQMMAERGIHVEKKTDKVEAEVLGEHSVLYPLWFLTWRKEDRVAYAVINGESGKVVSDLPLDYRSFAIVCVVVSAVLFAVLELFFQPTPMVTSFISLGAALAMGYGIRSGAKQEYERRVHANDKGWTADEGGDAEAGEKKEKKQEKKGPSKLILYLAAAGLLSIASQFVRSKTGSASTLVTMARYALPVLAIGHSCYVGAMVMRWQKHIQNRDALLGVVLLIVTVIINSAIVLISPVNDGWYYLGDALCIVGLMITSVAMIRLYNLGTTHPLPKLFDRTEVPS
ncbi:MAG: hypothetical protein Q4B54_09000 [Coriobacteriales bacterium]|nr:hypothetical protein [Coriobacteriales bacterium]